MDRNDHYLYKWFRLTNMNVLEVYSLGLGLGMFLAQNYNKDEYTEYHVSCYILDLICVFVNNFFIQVKLYVL